MAKKRAIPAGSIFSNLDGYRFVDPVNKRTTAIVEVTGKFTLKDEAGSTEIFPSWKDFVKTMGEAPTTEQDEFKVLEQLERLGLGPSEPIDPTTDHVQKIDQTPSKPKEENYNEMAKPKSKAKGAAKPAKEKKVKELHPCVCGCGEKVVKTFAQGHDARVHGWQKKIERGEMLFNEVPSKDVAGVVAWMKENGTKQGKMEPKAVKAKAPKKGKEAA